MSTGKKSGSMCYLVGLISLLKEEKDDLTQVKALLFT